MKKTMWWPMRVFRQPAVITAATSLLLTLAFVSKPSISDTYVTFLANNATSQNVYKSIDANGRVTYSFSVPDSALSTESIALSPPPDQRDIDAHATRQQTLAQAAQELDDARAQREAERNEREKQRLELMALSSQARQPDINEHSVYVGYPYWPWRARPYYGHGHGRQPDNHQTIGQSPMPLPPSSFRSMF